MTALIFELQIFLQSLLIAQLASAQFFVTRKKHLRPICVSIIRRFSWETLLHPGKNVTLYLKPNVRLKTNYFSYPPSARGVYYLATRAEPPYALG